MKHFILDGIIALTIITISISLLSEPIIAQTMMSPRQQMMNDMMNNQQFMQQLNP